MRHNRTHLIRLSISETFVSKFELQRNRIFSRIETPYAKFTFCLIVPVAILFFFFEFWVVGKRTDTDRNLSGVEKRFLLKEFLGVFHCSLDLRRSDQKCQWLAASSKLKFHTYLSITTFPNLIITYRHILGHIDT